MKIFKNVAFAAATTIIAATPLIATSCTKTVVKTIPELDSIKIDLPDENYEVAVGNFISSETPIDVVCLDKEGEIIDAQTSFVLTVDETNEIGWIWIDKQNKINIQANIEPGIYHFHIFAQSEDKKIKSKVKSFEVNVYEEKIIPDEISIISPEGEQLVFVGQQGNFSLGIEASKPGYEEFQLDKECDWEILNFADLPLDLQGRALFTLQGNKDGAKLVLSTNINESYIDTYILNIKASNKTDPSICDDCLISIKVANGLYFKDEDEIYTRPTLDSEWELTSISKDRSVLETVRAEIYGIPVSKIGDYFSSNSGFAKITVVILPPTIKTIGDYAFYGQTLLSTVKMPGVTSVGKFAFYSCYNMAEIPEKDQPDLVYIGDHGFYRCNNLKLNKLQNLVYLGDDSLEHVYMTEIHIGPKIQFMGYKCIAENDKLVNIYVDATTPPELAGALWGGQITMKPSIIVPANSLETYRSTLIWKNYTQYLVGK